MNCVTIDKFKMLGLGEAWPVRGKEIRAEIKMNEES
jgi:hypothetical protein